MLQAAAISPDATGSQAMSKARKSAFSHATSSLRLIMSCGDQDGVDGVACGAGEVIAFQQANALEHVNDARDQSPIIDP